MKAVAISDTHHVMSKTKRPLWLGALLAPLSAPIFVAVFAVLADWAAGHPDGIRQFLAAVIFTGPFALIGAYLATVIAWMPLVLLLRARNCLGFWWCTLSAIPIGALTVPFALWTLLEPPVRRDDFASIVTTQLSLGATVGFCVAALFCWIVGGIGPWQRGSKRRLG